MFCFRWLILAAAFCAPSFAMALSSFNGMVKLATGNTVYVEYTAPKKSAPTVLLLNGLTSRVGDWRAFANQLEKSGLGVVKFDFVGQGKTLINARGGTGVITIPAQVADTRALLKKLALKGPFHIAGFSYGGGVAQAFAAKYPKAVASLILMATFTEPIESQDAYLRLQVAQHRLLFPFDVRSFDEIYDRYLHAYIFMTYPSADPRLLENPYRLEGVFRLVQGIRHFKSDEVVGNLPDGKLHLMVGGLDALVPRKMHDEFWNNLPSSVKASRVILESCGHYIPELVPVFAAKWVKRIIKGDEALSHGKTYSVNPWFPLSQSETEHPKSAAVR